MRVHRHQVGKTNRWHSVRVHHDEAWDWCAHHEEIEHHLLGRRHMSRRLELSQDFRLQTTG
ncbi:MAG: hypothetical protein ACE149_18005 [Armatimonadota bacterium]